MRLAGSLIKSVSSSKRRSRGLGLEFLVSETDFKFLNYTVCGAKRQDVNPMPRFIRNSAFQA
jgi:hypothetical protein